MGLDVSSFGGAIGSARKAKEMSQKELAAKIVKEDGQPITPQYLNDIEHDRRSTSSDHMIDSSPKRLGFRRRRFSAYPAVWPSKTRSSCGAQRRRKSMKP